MDEESLRSPSAEGQVVAAPKKPRGRVFVVAERCKGCGYCVDFCPLNVLVMSPRFNAKGYHYPEVADGAKCSGCDLCGMYCPDFAIRGTKPPAKE
jgi:2-oxoglutarate ferredoxin oxidoreductase subunit delta